MHILVTDRLACSRCGPEFGLVLLAEDLQDRRVLQGALGCANCRERYPIERGFGDLRPAPRTNPVPEAIDFADDPDEALKLAALLGVQEGPGLVVLTGNAVRNAPRLASLVPGIEVVAVHPGLRGSVQVDGVTRVEVSERLPFLSGGIRGMVIEGEMSDASLAEAIRVLGPGSRLVVREPSPGAKGVLEAGGIEMLMDAESVLVGVRK